MIKRGLYKLLVCLVLLMCWVGSSNALVIEMWDADDADWVDRDPAEMAVSWTGNNIDGHEGVLKGTFAEQSVPQPETDSFRATDGSSGGKFTGNYFEEFTSLSSYEFDFYADDVLPSDFLIRFSGAGKTFTKNIKPQVVNIDQWYTVVASLENVTGWFGGTQDDFLAALSDVDWVEVQVTRNGRYEQDYYLDHFKINGVELPDSLGGWLACSGLLFVILSRKRSV